MSEVKFSRKKVNKKQSAADVFQPIRVCSDRENQWKSKSSWKKIKLQRAIQQRRETREFMLKIKQTSWYLASPPLVSSSDYKRKVNVTSKAAKAELFQRKMSQHNSPRMFGARRANIYLTVSCFLTFLRSFWLNTFFLQIFLFYFENLIFSIVERMYSSFNKLN